jgi:hypothetical protein
LELLKNRLIYLTTLYSPKEMAKDDSKSLRDSINDSWKEVYHQLGRNKLHPLNDNDFLRAHWTMYFKYSRQTGKDYVRFLLEVQFTPKLLHTKIGREVKLEAPEEMRSEDSLETEEEDNGPDEESPIAETPAVTAVGKLPARVIREFVGSLKESAVHWFHSFFPELATSMSEEERLWIDRLNRAGISYFRPLVMSVLKNEKSEKKRVWIFQRIERFIFICFKTTTARANYGSSEFYNFARALDRGEITLEAIDRALERRLAYAFDKEGKIRIDEFHTILFKKFEGGSGYYGWPGLRYFLYEYELSLLSESRQKKVDWKDLLTSRGDKISIEHVYPQTETSSWATSFGSIPEDQRYYFTGALGNLLLLSMSINSSLQNDSFEDKKKARMNASGIKIRNGYNDGSHSEIEVSTEPSWGPEQIKKRGLKLLRFMEERWMFKFKDDEDRERLLFLNKFELEAE